MRDEQQGIGNLFRFIIRQEKSSVCSKLMFGCLCKELGTGHYSNFIMFIVDFQFKKKTERERKQLERLIV